MEWFWFLSWVVLEAYLINFLRVLIREKKLLVKQMSDVKIEINNTSDLLAMTETDPADDYEETYYGEF